MKVQYDVDKEDDVHNAIDDEKRDLIHGFVFEGGVVGNRDRGVKGQGQNDPIPHCLE